MFISSDNLSVKLQKILDALDTEIKKCTLEITKLPENPAISVITHFPSAFAIRLSDVRDKNMNLSPAHHSWREQYALVKELLETHKFSSVSLLLSGGRIHFNKESRMLAEPVREKIALITGDLLLFSDDDTLLKAHSALLEAPKSSVRRRM